MPLNIHHLCGERICTREAGKCGKTVIFKMALMCGSRFIYFWLFDLSLETYPSDSMGMESLGGVLSWVFLHVGCLASGLIWSKNIRMALYNKNRTHEMVTDCFTKPAQEWIVKFRLHDDTNWPGTWSIL